MMGQPNGTIPRQTLACEDCDVEFSGVAARNAGRLTSLSRI
jgi:hypothetical protein